jgi:transcriptional repressor NrdR
MDCIYCGHKTKTINSRPQKRLQQVWRRRACPHCGAVFTTHEAVELGGSIVVQHPDGRIEPFTRDILFLSIVNALGHRTDATHEAGALTATIIAQLRQGQPGAVIPSSLIVKTAVKTLQRFDNAGSITYQAYHKD